MFDLSTRIMAFSFAEPNADMGDMNDIETEKYELIETFHRLMGVEK